MNGQQVTASLGTLTPQVTTTSGVSAFTLDVVELIEEAYEQAGMEMRTGYDLRTARRSLNLLALDWANRGYNLWTVEEAVINLTSGQATYTLPVDTIDIVEAVIRVSGSDIAIQRIGMPTYANIPTKDTRGRPVQFWVDRQKSPTLTLWPVPDGQQYSFVYWRMRRINDAGTNGALTFDVPERILPCLIAGLAYKLAQKRPELATRLPMLETEYARQWEWASTEDREKVSVRFVPHVY
jgi:hypothetical protein